MHISRCFTVAIIVGLETLVLSAPPGAGSPVTPGQAVILSDLQPQLLELKENDLTLEFWMRPDATTIGRPRVLLWLFANRAGSDVAGFGLSMAGGRVQANVLGVRFQAADPLVANQWSHVCLTIQARTLNKVATLWVNGKLIGRQRLGRPWPEKYYYVRLLGDPWNQQRYFSGTLGDIRLSRSIRYEEPFQPMADLARDKSTLLHVDGLAVPVQ